MSLRRQLKRATAAGTDTRHSRNGWRSPATAYRWTTTCITSSAPIATTRRRRLSRVWEQRAPYRTGLVPNLLREIRRARGRFEVFGRNVPSTPAPMAYVALPTAFPQSLGCAYVLEGATLGGVVLSRHFGRRFGLSTGKGASFLYGDGGDTAAKWVTFVRVADSVKFTDTEKRACIGAACETSAL